jgi:2-hydroxychromene-2-carboxylate isomerase
MAEPIDFYFDFSSPYGYFASSMVDGMAGRFERHVNWHPILIGVAFDETGNKPLIDQPLKGEYCAHDWQRVSRFMDVRWVLPKVFPISTHNAARLYYRLEGRDPELARKFARAAFHTYFGEGRDITSPEAVAEVAAPLGIEADEVHDTVHDPTAKEDLKRRTAEAIRRGVIGSPYVIVDGEGFWGSDRLWMVKKWMQSGGW